MIDVRQQLESYAQMTEAALENYLPKSDRRYARVVEAMRYSLSAGGKRIRPALVLAFCRLFGGREETALPFACAVEMIHTYSLIHDDLPCMDNDALRRGKPACHIAYGEDTALLAGDGLLTLAFATLARADLPDARKIEAVAALADAAGIHGMIGGQVIDLQSEGKVIDADTLHELQALKTGALLRVSAQLGAIAAGANAQQKAKAVQYADAIGLAFQITDDILDVTGDAATLGKPIGSDQCNEKSTFVSLYGLQHAYQRVADLEKQAVAAVAELEDSAFLCALAAYLSGRKN